MSKILSKNILLQIIILSIFLQQTFTYIEIPIRFVNSTYNSINNSTNLFKKSTKKVQNFTFNLSDFFEQDQLNKLHLNSSSEASGSFVILSSSLLASRIGIGTPSQSFDLILDTGSSLLWVPQIGSKDASPLTHHFIPSQSSSLKNSSYIFKIIYGTGSCSGFYASDYFHYLNTPIQITFGSALTTVLDVEGADGIWGLGNHYDEKSLDLLNLLKEKGLIESKEFSFKFDDTKDEGDKGKLIFGKHTDFTNSSDIASCNLVTDTEYMQSLWFCNCESFGLVFDDKEILTGQSFDVLFDTGTNVISLPLSLVYKIADELKTKNCALMQATHNIYLGCYANDEDQLPDFKITIGGAILTIPYYHLWMRTSYSGLYVLDINLENSDTYIIGQPFFWFYHTLFSAKDQKLYFKANKDMLVNKTPISVITYIMIALIVLGVIILITSVAIYFYKKKKINEGRPEPANYYRYN